MCWGACKSGSTVTNSRRWRAWSVRSPDRNSKTRKTRTNRLGKADEKALSVCSGSNLPRTGMAPESLGRWLLDGMVLIPRIKPLMCLKLTRITSFMTTTTMSMVRLPLDCDEVVWSEKHEREAGLSRIFTSSRKDGEFVMFDPLHEYKPQISNT